jgi:hypothetical protein
MTTVQTPDPVDSVAQPRAAVSAAGASATWSGRKFNTGERVTPGRRVVTYTLLVLGAMVLLIPFVFLVSASLKTEAEVNAGPLKLVPSRVQWSNYPTALGAGKMNFRPALANTVVITTLAVFGQVLSCSLVGFGFARFRFRGRSVLFIVMLSTMMLPAQVTMVPAADYPGVVCEPVLRVHVPAVFRADPGGVDGGGAGGRGEQLDDLLEADAAAVHAGDCDRGDLYVSGDLE